MRRAVLALKRARTNRASRLFDLEGRLFELAGRLFKLKDRLFEILSIWNQSLLPQSPLWLQPRNEVGPTDPSTMTETGVVMIHVVPYFVNRITSLPSLSYSICDYWPNFCAKLFAVTQHLY